MRAACPCGVASAEDIVRNEIEATVRDSTLANLDGTAIDAGLRVKAEENASVTTDAFASAVAANISFGGSINGGGVIAYSEIKSTTSATIGFGSVITSGDIEVTSANTATANAKTHGIDVTATLIGIGARGSFATSRIVPRRRRVGVFHANRCPRLSRSDRPPRPTRMPPPAR